MLDKASGTVTIEAAMLGTPMVTFYRVNALSWYLQRWRVRTPFLTMVNLVANRLVVPELIQEEMKLLGEANWWMPPKLRNRMPGAVAMTCPSPAPHAAPFRR